MGLWKRTLVYLGLVTDEELEDEEFSSYEEPPAESPAGIRKLSREELSTVTALPTRPMGAVHMVEPRSYDDAQEIGDKIKDQVSVIMNLQGVEENLFIRLTAFAAGLAYGVGGKVQKVAARVYLITPANIEVSAEDRRRLMERGLFDEF